MNLQLIVEGRTVHQADVADFSVFNENSLEYHIIDLPEIKGWYRVSKHEQFMVFILEVKSHKICDIELIAEHDHMEMSFLLKGEVDFEAGQPGTNSRTIGPSHNIFHSNGDSRKFTLSPPITKWLAISFPTKTFLEYIPNFPEFRSFHTTVQNHQSGFLFTEFAELSLSMTQLIHEIEHCSSDFPFKCLLIKIKVLELLWNQMDLSDKGDDAESELPESEYSKIEQARSIVEQNYIDPPHLSDLARRVGSNEFYLKKGFKALTGMTVFGYIHELRMKKAEELLTRQDWNIQQVAEAVGYKYAQHFSTAFKKSFGTTPGKYKQRYS